MDREKAVEYINGYYNEQINLNEFIIDYVVTRGKPLDNLEHFIQTVSFTGNLNTIIKYALDWCIREYNINTIWNKGDFVLAY